MKNSSSLAMSLVLTVRSRRVVEGSHCYSQASGGLLGAQALTRQITNAKGKVIIVQISRSGEVDQMNIEESCCRLFLSKVALLNTMLPVHCCDGWGGGKSSEQLRFCLGEAP